MLVWRFIKKIERYSLLSEAGNGVTSEHVVFNPSRTNLPVHDAHPCGGIRVNGYIQFVPL